MVTYIDRNGLYCSSVSLFESLEKVAPFCVLSGKTDSAFCLFLMGIKFYPHYIILCTHYRMWYISYKLIHILERCSKTSKLA